MKERCVILLNNFKNYNFEKRYFLDTTNTKIAETVEEIEKNKNFLI